MSAVATFGDLRDRLIADGIAEVERVYEADSPKRLGAVEGFELCRTLTTREEFETVLRARQRREHSEALRHRDPTEAQIARYWRHRYGTLQVEWVLGCMLVAGWAVPGDMLSGRATRKVAEVTAATGDRAPAVAPEEEAGSFTGDKT